MNAEDATPPELSPREKGFVARLMSKYPGGQRRGRDLYRSVLIFSVIVLAFHVIEQLMPAVWWGYVLGFVVVYPPAVWVFVRYRRFSIFRSCVLSKVGGRLAQYEPLDRPAPSAGGSHHPHRHQAPPP